MSRKSTSLLLALVLAAFSACTGGTVSFTGAVDTPDADVEDGTTDLPDADIPEVEVVTTPELTMVFQTASGPKGQDTDIVTLVKSDEPAAYADSPGFQMDIVVTTKNIENGTDVRLFVAGSLVSTVKAVVTAGIGTATFATIGLTHNPSGYEVRAEATNVLQETGEVLKTVKVDIGTCGIGLTPTNATCVLADADPVAAGFQVSFTVTNPERTCTTARLKVIIDGTTTTTDPVPLDASGAATIVATLLDHTAGVDGVSVQVAAEVSDTAAADRTAVTADLAYTLDLVDPTVAITAPAKALLTLQDDKDGDPSNGLTFDTAGTAAGMQTGDPLAITLDGTAVGAPVPDAGGLWSVPDLALTADGGHVIVATGLDSCGRTGRAEFTFQAKVTQAALTIMTPTAGAVLLAKDDGNPATALVYETNVVVLGEAVQAGTTLTVRCREDRLGTPELPVGSFTVVTPATDGMYPIAVALSVQALTSKVTCRVLDNASNPSVSGNVAFRVGLPAPELRILQPAIGARVNKTSLNVVLAATNLNTVVPVVRVLDALGVEALSFTPANPIKSGGLVFTLPLLVGGQPLADGDWTLDVGATDAFGNLAADTPTSRTQAPFTLDTVAPEVAITTPPTATLDPATNPTTDADSDAAPGYQTTVVVTVVSGGGTGTRVCLTVNGDKDCRTLADGETSATFLSVTLLPGSNDLSAQATDVGGNLGATVARTITLVLPGPRVRIIAPDKNGPLAVQSFNLTVQVTDVALVVQAGAPVTVSVNGTDTYTGATDATGTVTFPVTTLSTTGDTFVARSTVAGDEGVSAPRFLSFKVDQPVLTFRVPANEDVINLATVACEPGMANCALNVLIDTQNIEDGQAGQLTVTCGTSTIVYHGFVDTGVLTIPDVTLIDQKTCSLTATATDLANQTVTAGPISVRVDRFAPIIVAFQQPDPNVGALTYTIDEDPATPGLQFTFKVIVSAIDAGMAVNIDYGPLGGTMARVSVTVDTAVPNLTTRELVFPRVTLLDGTYELTASTTDGSGNTTTLSRLVDVLVDQPVIRLGSPVFVNNTACTTSSTCAAGGVCAGGFCATPWAAATPKNLIVSVSSLPSGVNNLRICSNKAGLPGTPCSTAGYRQVALGSSAGTGNTTITVSGLPDGSHGLIAEGLLTVGQPWSSSTASPNAIERFRYVFQDTVLPVVTTITSPSDTQAPANVLNIAEQVAAGRVYSIRVVASEPGSLAVVLNGVDGAGSADFTGDLALDATLREGANEIHARVTDLVGNVSPLPSSPAVVYYRPTVDTTAPLLGFDNPGAAVLKAGDSRDIVISSDGAIGRVVTLLDGGVQQDTATVGASGLVTFPFASLPVLTDGDHTLEARVTDDAGNPAVATHAVTVDTVLPDVLLVKPVGGAVLTDADDARPGSPGFQIEVSFGSPSTDASAWQIQLATNCDATFTTCDPPVRIAQGAITAAGGLEPSLFPTLPAAATPYYMVLAVVTDGVGNSNSSTAGITMNLAECQVSLAGVGNGSYINNLSCPTPGTDCASTSLTVTVTVSTSCGAVDSVRLLQTGVATQEKPLTGQSATFTATVNDGAALTFEGRAFESGTQSGSSGALARTVDLADPVVAFTSPAPASDNKWGTAADENATSAGLQKALSAQITDTNLAGGQVASLTYGGVAIVPTNIALPYTMVASPASISLAVTLTDQTSGSIVLTATDVAGNSATSTFAAKVDLLPPSSPTLDTVATADVNPRRPSVSLRWNAVGDNGISGGAATSYDIRYSPLPIVTETDFNAACSVAGLVYTAAVQAPAAPGTAEAFTITGPDIRNPTVTEHGTPCKFVAGTNPGDTNYAFAIRAVDAVGNASPVVASSVADVDLSLRYARVSGSVAPYNDSVFNKRVAYVGDLNNDGLGDLVVGGGGGTTGNTFCIVYGNGTGTAKTVADLTIAAATGTNHQCLTGASDALFGVPVVEAGDLNGDGTDDLVVGEGKLGAQTAKVWFGVSAGRLAATPNLTITGIVTTVASVSVAGGGDFNGDGVGDLLIGSPGGSIVYLLPGKSTWNAATALAINLQTPADRTANGIVAMTMTGGTAATRFGFRVAFVGDIDGDGKDEAAAATTAAPSQVLVFKGRDLTGVTAITVAVTTGGADDATVIRLAPDALSGADGFGNSSIAGRQDLDQDGSPDILVTHTGGAPLAGAKTLYMFRGGYLKTRFGSTIQVLATTGTGTGIVQNEKGFLISGQYDKAVPIGNFDNDADGTADIAYVIFASGTNHGKVFIRRNVKDPAGAFAYGTFPYESPILVDPLDPTAFRFGYFGAVPVGDFNGDGFPDLLVGTDGAGYAMILY
jgi:hypothetical protein